MLDKRVRLCYFVGDMVAEECCCAWQWAVPAGWTGNVYGVTSGRSFTTLVSEIFLVDMYID